MDSHEQRVSCMVGLSEADMEQIRSFAKTPRYARSPDHLCEDEEEQTSNG